MPNLFNNKNLTLDASFGAGLPVRNNNQARTGMPSLKFNVQAGPRLNWNIQESEHSRLKLRLPFRWGIDSSFRSQGWVTEPEVRWTILPDDHTTLRLSAGAMMTSQTFSDTYYTVLPQYATASRPAYQAQGGFHSLFAQGSLAYSYSDKVSVFTAITYRNMSMGSVANSPLVKTPHYVALFAGVSYLFWQSDEQVTEH